MHKIKIGIIGAAGYTGGEMLRILLLHPQVELLFANSKSQSQKKVVSVHADLLGLTDMMFSNDLTLAAAADLVFLCVGHGETWQYFEQLKAFPNLKIVDLSQDFRLASTDHAFVYGLPELNRPQIQESRYVANPGCFATAIQLSFLPLAAAGLLVDDLHVTAVTGSTGAGQQLTETSHFSWRSQNISVYKAFVHQHLAEMQQSIFALQPTWSKEINIIPMRGNFTRGILASVHTKIEWGEAELQDLYTSYYKTHRFVHIVVENPDLKQVINTNQVAMHLEKHGEYLHVVTVIDNLIKGASGQAVQNMNLMFGFEEQAGLRLKPVAF